MKNYFLLVFTFLLFSCNSSTDYYLVRHAEKVDESTNPPLSDAGIIRANVLKDSLINKDIDLLYATSYLRNQQTVQPLADALQKEVITYDAQKTWEFVEELKKIKDKNVVVVGHSNTLPDMISYFTGDSVMVGHGEYDQLFLIKKRKNLFNEKYELIVKKYGAE